MEETLYTGRVALRNYAVALGIGGILALLGFPMLFGVEVRGVGMAVFLTGVALIGAPYLVVFASEYEVTSTRARQCMGIVARKTSEIDLADVRNVQVKQGIFQRLFGVGNVQISTAGQSGFEVEFRGIVNPNRVAEIVRQAREDLKGG